MNNLLFDLGGTYRTQPPEKTWDMIQPVLPKVGITRIANVTGLDNIGISTHVAIRPNAASLSTSQGKGITPLLSKVSAAMESIELWHAENLDKAKLHGSHKALSHQYPLVPLEELQFNYHQPTEIETLDWLAVEDLLTGQQHYVPTNAISLDLTSTQYNTSNGLASGNTLAEATCHALFEVIERQDETIERNLKTKRYIDIASISTPLLTMLIEKVIQANGALLLQDMSHHHGLTTFKAVLVDKNRLSPLGTFSGSGSHISPIIAAARAITEAIQSRLTYISGSRDDAVIEHYQRIQDHSLLTQQQAQNISANTPFPATTETFADCDTLLDHILSLLQTKGVKNVYRYNHTKTDLNIPVVSVIIPYYSINLSIH